MTSRLYAKSSVNKQGLKQIAETNQWKAFFFRDAMIFVAGRDSGCCLEEGNEIQTFERDFGFE